jgi:hypothetical protein
MLFELRIGQSFAVKKQEDGKIAQRAEKLRLKLKICKRVQIRPDSRIVLR